jgi:hypothetical protein
VIAWRTPESTGACAAVRGTAIKQELKRLDDGPEFSAAQLAPTVIHDMLAGSSQNPADQAGGTDR